MTVIFLILALFYSGDFAKALTYEIVGACSAVPAYHGSHENFPTDAGTATVAILERNKIPFLGSAAGIHSILNTPVGDEAIEVINDQEMRAYGWCYEVDDKQPDVMPDKVMLTGSEHLKWFYAFSHYKSGNWLTYCEPAFTVKPKNICR